MEQELGKKLNFDAVKEVLKAKMQEEFNLEL